MKTKVITQERMKQLVELITTYSDTLAMRSKGPGRWSEIWQRNHYKDKKLYFNYWIAYDNNGPYTIMKYRNRRPVRIYVTE